MTFENKVTYRRKPETVRAARLTAESHIAIAYNWLERLIAEKRLSHGDGGWFVRTERQDGNHVWTQAAYGGDWIVLHDGPEGRIEVMSDGRFRDLYEGYDVEEDVDA